MTDRDDPLNLLGRLTDRPFPVREIPSEPAHAHSLANEHANEHVVSKLEIPAEAVQAAARAVEAAWCDAVTSTQAEFEEVLARAAVEAAAPLIAKRIAALRECTAVCRDVEVERDELLATLETTSAELAASRAEYDRTLNLLMTVDGRLDAATDRAEQAEERADALEQALARVVRLALDMRGWCSPHGVAPQYADRIAEAILGLNSIASWPGSALDALESRGTFLLTDPAPSTGDTP
ncbi:hypothetical protein HS041_12190 [Planomonospora sp. ID67723]|uniref:hypothetical protein n=1 Tax=Planomonospora sp. ID67723 TaxID=2738134 RepID=UPI0018C3AF9E|nr:hypothetical protein [Planomonospora sp. ID67723]MBG0828528.1 hypothetical protein [Planomonospora sp. ID67723]